MFGCISQRVRSDAEIRMPQSLFIVDLQIWVKEEESYAEGETVQLRYLSPTEKRVRLSYSHNNGQHIIV